ncbi:hypothetical protein ACK3TF_005841 [Chlorella vulgaris]
MAVQLPPPAPGYLAPPSWPVSLDWTEEEQRALEAGVQSHPPDRFDTVQRYVKIAAMLPRKSVRDVALRVRWTINQQLLKKRKPGEPLLPTGVSGAKKATVPGGALLPPKAPTLPPMPMMPGMGPLPAAAAAPSDAPANSLVGGPIGDLLEANFVILNEFRANMAEFKVPENTELLVAFRDNVLAIINAMEAMGGVMAQMPQLPVRLNVDLANNFLPTRPTSLPRHNLAMPPPQPALNAPGMVPLSEDYGGPRAGSMPPPPPAPPPQGGGGHGGAHGGGGGGPMAFLGGSFGGAPALIRQEQPVLVKKQDG